MKQKCVPFTGFLKLKNKSERNLFSVMLMSTWFDVMSDVIVNLCSQRLWDFRNQTGLLLSFLFCIICENSLVFTSLNSIFIRKNTARLLCFKMSNVPENAPHRKLSQNWQFVVMFWNVFINAKTTGIILTLQTALGLRARTPARPQPAPDARTRIFARLVSNSLFIFSTSL